MTLSITPSAAPALPAAAPALSSSATAKPGREDLAAAARRFEAIFVRQILAEARKTDLGGKDLFGSQGLDTFRQMMDERFADIAAERGAFGIGRMLETHLAALNGGGQGGIQPGGGQG
jgi:peptidoglycan hydrolase FlgJ